MSYDFAILGGGAAGLSLALELVRSPLQDRSILIVEKDAKDTNDRTWCFWADRPTPFDGIARRAWPRLRFQTEGFDRTWELAPFRYEMVRGLDFYNHARAELEKHNVTFLRGEGQVDDGSDHVTVTVNLPTHNVTTCNASYAFDSRIRPADMAALPERYITLKQHFTGWEVETDAPVFDPQTVTLFDLRTPQRGGVTFFYVLPFSPTNALVEYTLFSQKELPEVEYEEALKAYLAGIFGSKDYRILEREHGVIPMTDRPFPRRLGRRIMAIGTRGGRVKPSTGYAFSRIQRDSQRIVRSLVRDGQPFNVPSDSLRFRIYDKVILDILATEPQLGRPILSTIFAKNPLQPVLKFLDDRSSFFEDLRILTAYPPGPFLRALGRKLISTFPGGKHAA
jgi:lycopene beta-cyclase